MGNKSRIAVGTQETSLPLDEKRTTVRITSNREARFRFESGVTLYAGFKLMAWETLELPAKGKLYLISKHVDCIVTVEYPEE